MVDARRVDRAAARRRRRQGRRRDEPGDVVVGGAAPARADQPGQSVLVLGATGNAGAMAVQVAKRLGAGRVVGAGRDPMRLRALSALGADEVVQLTDDAEATATRSPRLPPRSTSCSTTCGASLRGAR